MYMRTDHEILDQFSKLRNQSERTKLNYKHTIAVYTDFNHKSLSELITEAKKEEKERIPWVDRTLKKRLVEFREYLFKKYMYTTAKAHMQRIRTIYHYFELELQPLPYFSTKQVKHAIPLTYRDLPDKDIIREALNISTPLMRAIILFMSSSGTAKMETLSLTITDFIQSVSEYIHETDIHQAISMLKQRNDIVPMFKLRRKKVNEFYYTFCSPEATSAIIDYLVTREDKITPDSKLFKIHPVTLTESFININKTLGLGKKSTYNRFRSHMLRKYHSTTLKDCENRLSIEDIDFLQGRSDTKTRRSYFIDKHQKIHIKDYGSIEAIKHYAQELNADIKHIKLKSQFRCNGSDGYLSWLDNTLQIEETANYDGFNFDYTFQVVNNPNKLKKIIFEKNKINNNSRLLAGYCWNWIKEGKNNTNLHDIVINDFSMSWNLGNSKTWAIDKTSINEIGCIHTSQGLEFDYVGVIIGKDLRYENGKIITDFTKRAKTDQSLKGIKKMYKENPQKALKTADEIIKNTYRTLLTRGMKGCYIYCEDKNLAKYLKDKSQ